MSEVKNLKTNITYSLTSNRLYITQWMQQIFMEIILMKLHMCIFKIQIYTKCPTLLRKVKRWGKWKSIIILKTDSLLQYKLLLLRTKWDLDPKVGPRKPWRLIQFEGLLLNLPILHGKTVHASCVMGTRVTQTLGTVWKNTFSIPLTDTML